MKKNYKTILNGSQKPFYFVFIWMFEFFEDSKKIFLNFLIFSLNFYIKNTLTIVTKIVDDLKRINEKHFKSKKEVAEDVTADTEDSSADKNEKSKLKLFYQKLFRVFHTLFRKFLQ